MLIHKSLAAPSAAGGVYPWRSPGGVSSPRLYICMEQWTARVLGIGQFVRRRLASASHSCETLCSLREGVVILTVSPSRARQDSWKALAPRAKAAWARQFGPA